MKRSTLLTRLRAAGYHNDTRSLTRLYVENKITMPDALAAFEAGVAMKKKGIACSCHDCLEHSKPRGTQ